MNKQSKHYEKVGDNLITCKKYHDAENAYRSAENHLIQSENNYLQNYRRIQKKLIQCIDEQADNYYWL
jgi:hypothetical protein